MLADPLKDDKGKSVTMTVRTIPPGGFADEQALGKETAPGPAVGSGEKKKTFWSRGKDKPPEPSSDEVAYRRLRTRSARLLGCIAESIAMAAAEPAAGGGAGLEKAPPRAMMNFLRRLVGDGMRFPPPAKPQAPEYSPVVAAATAEAGRSPSAWLWPSEKARLELVPRPAHRHHTQHHRPRHHQRQQRRHYASPQTSPAGARADTMGPHRVLVVVSIVGRPQTACLGGLGG